MADAIDFQPYLKALPDPANHDWGDRYAPTQVKLPLKVQAIVPENPGDPTAQRQVDAQKRERFEVLEGLRKALREHHRVLLIGKPGSGKSTALRRLLWEEAQQCLAIEEHAIPSTRPPTHSSTIPVLIELRDCRSGSVLEWIQKALRRLRLSHAAVEDLLFAGRLLLLFDGLNELPSSDAWVALDEFRRDKDFHTVPIIVTTRELGAGADIGIEKKLEMVPLTEPQMREFIQKRLPGQADNLLRQLKDRLRELAETPLLLQMLCDVVAESNDGQIPQNRGELFRQEFARRYEAFKPLRGRVSDDSRRFASEFLQHLAFVMTQGEPHTDPLKPTPSWLTIPKTQAETILETYLTGRVEAPAQAAKEWLEDLLEFHLLQIASNPDQIEFHHQLFQEYYAAEALLQKLPKLSDTELKQNYLNYLKWTEAIALMLSINKEEKYAETVVRLALEVDLNLGAMLAGKAKPELQKMTVDLLVKHRVLQRHRLFPWITYKAKVSGSVKSKLLGSTHSNKAGFHLLKMKTKDGAIDPGAIDAIGAIGSEAAFQFLLKLVQRRYSDITHPAIRAILTYSSEEEITRMFKLVILEEPNINLWIDCWEDIADHIERYRPKAAIPGLKQCLLYEKLPQHIRERAASLLGGIGTEEAIASLEDCRNKIPRPQSDPPTQSQKIISYSFLARRSNPDDDLRELHESIGKALEIATGNTPISMESLNPVDEDPILPKRAIPNLDLLDKDPFMRLLDIVTLKANQIDLQGLHDENPLIREAIAIKLGEKSPKKAIFFWKQILDMMTGLSLLFNHDPDFDPFLGEKAEDLSFTAKLEVRLAFVLPHWRQVLWGLISWREMLSDSSVLSIESIESLYELAVKELYEIARNEAIQALIQALCKTVCTGGSGLREIAFKELKNIDEERAIETLILKGLNSSRWDVRVWTAKTLRRIADKREIPQAVLPLLRSLDDKVPQIRTEIALSVGKIASENLLPDLVGLVTDPSGCIALTAIKEIQKDYGFYNYDIAQSAKEVSDVSSVKRGEESESRDKSDKMDELLERIKAMQETPRNSLEGATIYGPVNNAPNYGDQRTTNIVAQQNHVEAVKEIQELLDQLAQTYSTTTEANQEAAVRDVQQHKPELRARIVGAIEKGGEKALEKLFDHPAMAIMIAVYEGFKKG